MTKRKEKKQNKQRETEEIEEKQLVEQSEEERESEEEKEEEEEPEMKVDLAEEQRKEKEQKIKALTDKIRIIDQLIQRHKHVTFLNLEQRKHFREIVQKKEGFQEELGDLIGHASHSLFCYFFTFLFFVFIFFSKFQEEFYQRFSHQQENFYETMDLTSRASKQDIKKKYRELVKIYHPDKNPTCEDCPAKFIKI